ncbi:MAG: sigma-70 family RNA polymerase sigma factor [Hyphomicrobiaceae bacterium]|nr:sigma-70 family RNA polymerase sigma factor [Hyphomicrobiaceae bacterium]
MADNETTSHSRLIERVAANQDRHAFMLLFAFFGPRVKGFMMRSGASDAYAEELAQETLLTVWRKAQTFDASRASASTWIFTIARNLRIDGLRREKLAANAQAQLDVLDLDVERPDQTLNSVERAERLRAALSGLSPDQLDLVRLSFFEDKPHPEIAKALNIPLGTVKSRLRRSMMLLREILEDLK